MPIWLRRYTFNVINEFYVNEKQEYEKTLGKGETITNNTPISRPNIPNLKDAKPTYNSTVKKKIGT